MAVNPATEIVAVAFSIISKHVVLALRYQNKQLLFVTPLWAVMENNDTNSEMLWA